MWQSISFHAVMDSVASGFAFFASRAASGKGSTAGDWADPGTCPRPNFGVCVSNADLEGSTPQACGLESSANRPSGASGPDGGAGRFGASVLRPVPVQRQAAQARPGPFPFPLAAAKR